MLDAVGYAAAIFHRGGTSRAVSHDSAGPGRKWRGRQNAVNAFSLKNLIGRFAPPFAVVNDGAFIDRLPARDKRGGMAEAIKVAMSRDRDFFGWIEGQAEALADFEPNSLDLLIERCAKLHMHQITHGGDPFEAGSSRPLDFGHWSAHKLEMLTGHALSLGEAVALGIALDARYSVLAGLMEPGQDEHIRRVLIALGFDLRSEALQRREPCGSFSVLQGLREFQEHLGGALTITLLRDIGTGVDVHAIEQALVERAVGWLADPQG